MSGQQEAPLIDVGPIASGITNDSAPLSFIGVMSF
jgi:hypothetical protein